MAFATIEQVAHVLKLTPRRIQQLVKLEGMPRISRGEYDLVQCVHWYIAHLTRRIEEASRGTTETESQARARYIAAIADLRQMDVAERRGELIRNDEAVRIIEPVLMAMRSKLLSVPRRVSILVSPSELEDRIRVESFVDNLVRETLEDISNIPVQVQEIGEKKRQRWSRAQSMDPPVKDRANSGKKAKKSKGQ